LLYGAAHRDRWGVGLTTLIAAADMLAVLDAEDRFLALFHGIVAVADDCDGEPPRVDSEPLGGNVPLATPRVGSAIG
jgi:hypothetical protein